MLRMLRMNLTRTPLLSTRRKVDSHGWQSKDGREEGGNRTCYVFIITSQILWTIVGCGYSGKISFQSYDSLFRPKFTKLVLIFRRGAISNAPPC